MKKILLILIILLTICGQSYSADFSLPSSRSVTWTGNVGVLGGIPADRTQCGSTITATSGDRTSTIQSALNACGSGHYVLLGPGSFNITVLHMVSGVTLRGSGMGVTTLVAGASEFLQFGGYGIAYGTAVGLASGYTKGSTSITTSSAHGWSAGDVIVVDQTNDPTGDPVITNVGEGGSMTMGGRTGDGTRCLQQVVKLVAPTSGSTATLEIPLYWNVNATKTPQAAKITMAVSGAGVEHLTLDNTVANYIYAVTIFNADNCWFDHVELHGTGDSGFGMYMAASYRVSIVNSLIHQEADGSAADNYGIITGGTGSAYLIENNRIYNVTNGVVTQGGFSGSVVAYNYFTNLWQAAYPSANRYAFGFHGSHQIQNLFEGNAVYGAYFSSDNYWGSNSHNTLFRNRFTQDYAKTDQSLDFALSANQTYYNVIGNYLGTAGQESVYEGTTTPYSPSAMYIYIIATGTAKTTMLRHANYDTVTAGQKWCDTSGEPGCQSGSTEHTLPNSLYLTAKPSWFCNESNYPSVKPDGVSDALRYYKIPAQQAYEGGNCTLGGVDETPPTLTSITIGSNGTTWTFVFNEVVTTGAGGYTSTDASVSTSTQGAVSLAYTTGWGTNTIVFEGNKTVLSGETITAGYNYTQPVNGVEDASGNDLTTMTSHAVVNNSTQTGVPPTPVIHIGVAGDPALKLGTGAAFRLDN